MEAVIPAGMYIYVYSSLNKVIVCGLSGTAARVNFLTLDLYIAQCRLMRTKGTFCPLCPCIDVNGLENVG